MRFELSGYEMVFPLMTGVASKPGLFDSNNVILGAAFRLGSEYLATAGHVARALQEPGRIPLLATPVPGEDGLTSVTPIRDIELLPHDLAILKVNIGEDPVAFDPVIPWYEKEVTPFDNLWAIGYPYGLLPAGRQHRFQIRCFQGHAVANPTSYELPTDNGRPADVYELSFQAPRGLSGAPLIVGLPNRQAQVAGIIVGNSSQSMIVHTSSETERSTGQTTIVERHESLTLGIAVQSSQALQLHSRILNSTIGGFLAARGALVGRRNDD